MAHRQRYYFEYVPRWELKKTQAVHHIGGAPYVITKATDLDDNIDPHNDFYIEASSMDEAVTKARFLDAIDAPPDSHLNLEFFDVPF